MNSIAAVNLCVKEEDELMYVGIQFAVSLWFRQWEYTYLFSKSA